MQISAQEQFSEWRQAGSTFSRGDGVSPLLERSKEIQDGGALGESGDTVGDDGGKLWLSTAFLKRFILDELTSLLDLDEAYFEVRRIDPESIHGPDEKAKAKRAHKKANQAIGSAISRGLERRAVRR